MSARAQRFLVACHNIVLSGGLLRFDRVGRVLRHWGHEIAFVVLADGADAKRPTALPVLSLDEAAATSWDAVMVPGAGFPAETLERFEVFRHENFGVRVQHILSDQTRRPRYKIVNEAFSPHILIFNNLYWPAGSFAELRADRSHVLLGAVDVHSFRPAAHRSHPLTAGQWIVGGLAKVNPQPLLETLEDLPSGVVLKLFGPDVRGLAKTHQDLIRRGRLELIGPLHGDDLYRFYHDVDCVVSAATVAGWCNLAAEAMASGVPVICTPHGTGAFARHEDTALIVETPTLPALAGAVRRVMEDPTLCQRMAARGRSTIAAYSWETYTRQLLALLDT
jgi:glycosyltransferase involved in cell wall biosynthesis